MKHAFLFPGQGAQYGGMGKDLAERFDSVRDVYKRAGDRLGIDLADICFNGSDDDLVRTDIQQPAILVHSIATLTALRELKGEAAVTPDAACGLSLGEYTALVAAGVLSLEDGAHLVRQRGLFMQEACEAYPSTLASVLRLPRAEIEAACATAASETGEHCVLGNILADGGADGAKTNITISGGQKAVARAIEIVKEKKGRAVELPVAGAFHSPYMKSAEEKLAAEIGAAPMQTPRCPIVSNVDAKPTTDVETIRANLVRQLTSSVLWADTLTHLLGADYKQFTEIGPGRALTNGLKRQVGDGYTLNAYGTVKDLEAE